MFVNDMMDDRNDALFDEGYDTTQVSMMDEQVILSIQMIRSLDK